MANKLVNLRLSQGLLMELDSIVNEGVFSSRTEFIKDAIKAKLEEYRTQQAMKLLRKGLGMGKRLGLKEPSQEELEKIREELGEKMLKEHGLL